MSRRAERRASVRYRWDRLKVSFWFTPALMALAAVLLAWSMYWLDGRIPDELTQSSRFVLSGNANELRSALLSMATTVLATAGVVFSLLTIPLSTVAAQYGSRLLRLFLGDRTTQIVLGMFVATFVYCIAAALSIPPADVERESPYLTATVGLYLMLATFATLILLIHHISTTLQAPNIAAAAAAELMDVIGAAATNNMPAENAVGIEAKVLPSTGSAPEPDAAPGHPIHANSTGYIQFVDPEILMGMARTKDLVIRVLQPPGRFVRSGTAVGLVFPADRVDEQLATTILRAFQVGNGRTPTQDIEYAVNQLAEMAVRAMSPAINDPFTAMTCLDHLGVGLGAVAREPERGSQYFDSRGKLRVVMDAPTLDTLLDAAFDMLRHASCDNASVMLHMLKTIDAIGQSTAVDAVRQSLLRHVGLILAESQAGRLIEDDKKRIEVATHAVARNLHTAQQGKEPN